MASGDRRIEIQAFLFGALSFEAEARTFQEAGYQVGAGDDAALAGERDLLDNFPMDVRSEAFRMARLYTVLYCLENAARQFIEARLEESVGENWWSQIPPEVKGQAEKRQADAEANQWMEADNSDPMKYVDFSALAKIVISKWEFFSDIIPSEQWLQSRFDEMGRARNSIAHHRLLSDGEFQGLDMHVRDWIRQAS